MQWGNVPPDARTPPPFCMNRDNARSSSSRRIGLNSAFLGSARLYPLYPNIQTSSYTPKLGTDVSKSNLPQIVASTSPSRWAVSRKILGLTLLFKILMRWEMEKLLSFLSWAPRLNQPSTTSRRRTRDILSFLVSEEQWKGDKTISRIFLWRQFYNHNHQSQKKRSASN